MVFALITTGGEIGALAFHNPKSPPATLRFAAGEGVGSDPVICAFRRGLAGVMPDQYRAISIAPAAARAIDRALFDRLEREISSSRFVRQIVTLKLGDILPVAERLHASRDLGMADKQIVLTGATVPLLNASDSDGFQNLRLAVERLERPVPATGREPTQISIVLSDRADKPVSWQPKIYRYEPGRYQLDSDPPQRG